MLRRWRGSSIAFVYGLRNDEALLHVRIPILSSRFANRDRSAVPVVLSKDLLSIGADMMTQLDLQSPKALRNKRQSRSQPKTWCVTQLFGFSPAQRSRRMGLKFSFMVLPSSTEAPVKSSFSVIPEKLVFIL